jgi:UPF0271 protein
MAAVLDANVFMRGKGVNRSDCYTTPSVMEEMESSSSRLSFDTSDVHVQEPSRDGLEKVEQKSREINAETSGEDERLLALALDLDATIITDDLGLQNLASHLGVEFEAYMGEEIGEQREWKRVCANCGSKVSGEKCSRCGSTRVERKPG